MAWDIEVKTRVYHLLANEIFFRIYNGTYPPGAKLSSLPVFAKEVGSSPETVRKAIFELRKHGIVERNRLGYFVTSNHEKVLEYRDSCLGAVEERYFEVKQKVGKTVLEINQGQF